MSQEHNRKLAQANCETKLLHWIPGRWGGGGSCDCGADSGGGGR